MQMAGMILGTRSGSDSALSPVLPVAQASFIDTIMQDPAPYVNQNIPTLLKVPSVCVW